ncbi:reverse transcriptase domain-containing protein, partial [Tanacetum coccineum]
MDAMTIKMDAQYKELQSCAKKPTPDLDDDDMPMSREEEAKFMQTFCKTRFYIDYRDRDSNRDNWCSNGRNDYNRDNYRSNTDDKPYDLQKQFNDFMKSQQSTNTLLADKKSGQPSGSLPSNTQPNPRCSNSKAYQQLQARNEHVNVVFTRSGKTYNPPDNSDDQQNKSENPINFDSDDEDDAPTPQPKAQPIKLVKETPLPKPYKPKILDESSTMIQNKVPPKLGDPGSFLIPCNFNKTFSSNALANLGASINLMSYTLYAKLSLETLKPTKMSKQLNLGVGTEWMIFNIDSAMKHFYSNDDTCFSNVIDEILEEDFDALLDEGSKILHSIEGTLLEEEIFSEFDEFMAMTTIENFESESDTEEPPFKKIAINSDYKMKTSLKEPPTDLEIKPLLENLEYVFLEEPSFLLVIISSNLSAQNKSKLEKCHFMVKEGIVLGHKVSSARLEVDKAKINIISKLPPPTNIKDTPFKFDDECQKAFELLKEKLTCAPMIVSPNWNLLFKLMCDASDFEVGAVLEFDIEIKDRKGTENVAANHLSRIENDESSNDSEVDDNFPIETLMEINTKDEPWFTDFANYLVADIIPKGMMYQQKNKFFSDLKHYFWEEPITPRNL